MPEARRTWTAPHLEGRNPSHDPDVYVDIRKVKVDEIYVDVEQLEAHLALRAKLANLLQVERISQPHTAEAVVTIPDFELRGSLRARRLTTHTPPDTRFESSAVTLERREARVGLPPRVEPGERYANVVVDRRLRGELHDGR